MGCCPSGGEGGRSGAKVNPVQVKACPCPVLGVPNQGKKKNWGWGWGTGSVPVVVGQKCGVWGQAEWEGQGSCGGKNHRTKMGVEGKGVG